MSKLEELIQELCPDGVEYTALNSVCKICGRIGFRGYTRQDQVVQGEGAISLSPSNIQNGELSVDNCTYISWYKYEESPEIQASVGDIVFGKTASVGKTALIRNLPEKATINPQLVLLKEIKCNPVYLSYFLKTKKFQSMVNKIKGLGTIPTISQRDFGMLQVPVPPLPVQQEIVGILDSITQLTAELQAELQARKKQYEHYASKLFFETDADWVAMADIASFVYGYTDKAKDTGNTRFIRITDIDDQGHLKGDEPKYIDMNAEAKKSILSFGDLVMARTGATYGKTLFFESEFPSVYASFLIKITPDNSRLLNRYYWHFAKTPLYWEQANKLVATGGQPQFNTPAIKQVRVPVPTIEEQAHIVEVLDRLDSLVNDISTGLPAEIAARQKQYEYYRDKLLTFKELGA